MKDGRGLKLGWKNGKEFSRLGKFSTEIEINRSDAGADKSGDEL